MRLCGHWKVIRNGLVLALFFAGACKGAGISASDVPVGTYSVVAHTFASQAASAKTYTGSVNFMRVAGDSLYASFAVRGFPIATQIGRFNVDAYRFDVQASDTTSFVLGGNTVTSVNFTNIVLRVGRAGGGLSCVASTYAITGSGGLVSGGGDCTLSR